MVLAAKIECFQALIEKKRQREKEREEKSEGLSIFSEKLNISLKAPCGRLFAELAAVIPIFVFVPFAT